VPPASSNVNILLSGLQPTPASCQAQVEPLKRASPTPEKHPAEPLRDGSFRLGSRPLPGWFRASKQPQRRRCFRGDVKAETRGPGSVYRGYSGLWERLLQAPRFLLLREHRRASRTRYKSCMGEGERLMNPA